MKHQFQQTNYEKELRKAKAMPTEQLEELIKKEWDEYFPVFSRVTNLEKITKDKTADDETICKAYLELIAIYPSYRKLESQHLMHLQVLEAKLYESMTDEQKQSLHLYQM